MPFEIDVVVAGGGPVGCASSLAFARRGARVLLLDPSPGRARRFAGELLHPAALRALRELGIHDLPAAQGHAALRGFAVVPSRDQPAHLLHYQGEHGATFLFEDYLSDLREQAASHPLVTWMPGARVEEVDGQTVTYTQTAQGRRIERSVVSALVVGAHGKHGRLGVAAQQVPAERLSTMAGVLVHGVELPHEGFGHVVLSAVGPALVYRVAADQVRVCLDVPSPWRHATRRNALTWEAYGAVLPPAIARAVQIELEADRVTWAVNAVRPRTAYGREGFASVGDAVGHFHPMTATGMTLGFGDALALVHAPDVATYAAQRTRDTQVPGLLATALYEIFSLQSEPTDACRRAIFDMWRTRPEVRARTMGLLACEEVRLGSLVGIGAELVSRAMAHVTRQRTSSLRLQGSLSTVQRMAGLIHWLLTDSVPQPMQLPLLSRAATPFALIREEQIGRIAADLRHAESA